MTVKYNYITRKPSHDMPARSRDRQGQWRNNKIMIIQNIAYDQQIKKQETEKSNIVNPKTKLTNGRLELLQKPDPFSDYTIPSVRRT